MNRGAILVSSCLLAPPVVWASTILDPLSAPGVSDTDYRNLGDAFPSVGRVNGNGFFDGSGVLIGDRWVLTAGHIGSFASRATFTISGTNYISTNITVHSGYRFSFSATPNDLALIELQNPVAGVTPASILGYSSPTDLLSLEATWVGFGLGGTGVTGQSGSQAKRGFTNIIDSQGGFGLPNTAFLADFDHPDGSGNSGPGSNPNPTSLEGNVASGDSGGGTFVEIGGLHYLIGINSFQADPLPDSGINGDYGDLSASTNLALYYDWIDMVSGIRPVPEPSLAVSILFACGLLTLRRSRQ